MKKYLLIFIMTISVLAQTEYRGLEVRGLPDQDYDVEKSAGMVADIRADRGIITDNTGTNVVVWSDWTGNNHNFYAFQEGTNFQPSFNLSFPTNNIPAVSFYNIPTTKVVRMINTSMMQAGLFGNQKPFTVIACANVGTNNSGGIVCFANRGATNTNADQVRLCGDLTGGLGSSVYFMMVSTNAGAQSHSIQTSGGTNAFYFTAVTWDGTNIWGWNNLVRSIAPLTYPSAVTAYDNITLGGCTRPSAVFSNPLWGAINEVQFYTNDLNQIGRITNIINRANARLPAPIY